MLVLAFNPCLTPTVVASSRRMYLRAGLDGKTLEYYARLLADSTMCADRGARRMQHLADAALMRVSERFRHNGMTPAQRVAFFEEEEIDAQR